MTADDPVLGRVADTTRVSPEPDELVEEFATVCYEVGWQHAKGTPPDIAEASREEIRARLESTVSSQRAEIERLQLREREALDAHGASFRALDQIRLLLNMEDLDDYQSVVQSVERLQRVVEAAREAMLSSTAEVDESSGRPEFHGRFRIGSRSFKTFESALAAYDARRAK